MLKITDNTKLKKLKELTAYERQNIFIDAITFIGKFKGIRHEASDIAEMYMQMEYFINSKFSSLKVHEILVIMEKGMAGEYGKEFKFCADTFVNWIGQYSRDSASDRYRGIIKNITENTPVSEVTEESKLYALAVFIRTCCDPGGKICQEENIKLEDIVAGLKQNLNVLTGSEYSKKECMKIANSHESILFTKSHRG